MLQPVGELDVVADCHRGERDRQVRIDGLSGPVVDRTGGQVVLGYPKCLLDAPEPVAGLGDEGGGCTGQVGGVAFPPGQRAGLGFQAVFTDFVVPVGLDG